MTADQLQWFYLSLYKTNKLGNNGREIHLDKKKPTVIWMEVKLKILIILNCGAHEITELKRNPNLQRLYQYRKWGKLVTCYLTDNIEGLTRSLL